MPGIAGFINKRPPEERTAALGEMVKCMMHEPFYSAATHVDTQTGLGIGWASHKGSFSDCLPIWNEAHNVCLFFSGEHFGEHESDVQKLRIKSHKVAAKNASYLIHWYEEQGLGFLEKLNGWFSGVLLDLRQNKVVLFNDRYGLNRIYYHETADSFYFASEAKALLKILPDLRRLDLAGLGETFSCGCVLQNRSLFSGVSLLPGGSAWIFSSDSSVKKERYFSKESFENQPLFGEEEYYEKLKEAFVRILPRYLNAEQRIATSLTGGVDSRMIMAWARRAPGTLPCYTFGGMYRDCGDVKIGRRVASICQQPHEVIPVGAEFLSAFPALAEKTVYITDGTMDVTGAADLFVNQRARQIAPIRMTGNYGGEILRSIVAFKPTSLHQELLDPQIAKYVDAGRQTYGAEVAGRRLSFVAFKQVPWHHYSRLSLERSQLTLRSPYLDNELVALVYRAPSNLALSSDPSLRLIADGNPTLGRIATDRGLVSLPIPLVTRTKHLFQEFTFRAEYAYDYGMPQWLAKVDHTLASLHLEKLFLGRHKFHHFRVWYRDELSGYLKEVLLDPRTRNRSYYQNGAVEKIITEHVKGTRNYTREIHRILTTELLERRLIEQN